MSKNKKYTRRQNLKVPSKRRVIEFITEAGGVCDLQMIVKEYQLSERSERKLLKTKLSSLSSKGLIQVEGGQITLIQDRYELVVGTVSSHPRGFAFLVPEDGESDTFLPPREARKVLHGDKIMIRLVAHKNKDKVYGKVVKVLEVCHRVVIGRYLKDAYGQPVIEPVGASLKSSIKLKPSNTITVRNGELISANILRTEKGLVSPVAEVREILGDFSEKDMPLKLAIVNNSIPTDWSQESLSEISKLDGFPEPENSSIRTDLRDYPFVTIDGLDAKDFDDAVYAEKSSSGYSLFVAIADVSAYVIAGGLIDQEAFQRGNSVYFSRSVVPMLPEVLSNDLCSLLPDRDRLTLVARLELNEKGELGENQFYQAVIRSRKRLTYDDVQKVYDGNLLEIDLPPEVIENLSNLKKVFECLRGARESRQSLEIDGSEVRYEFNSHHRIEKIVPARRVDSHKVIEECMIATNVAAAQIFGDSLIPFRHHPEPDVDKLESLRGEAKKIGITVSKVMDDPMSLCNAILKKANDREDKFLIESMVMRSQKLAYYSSIDKNHFGLALSEYTHFTSPIRRYSDLVVHRLVKQKIGVGTLEPISATDMESISRQCSRLERRAEDATREEMAYLKCEFMERKIGSIFQAVVTTVVEFGVFVQIIPNMIEGFIPLEGQFAVTNKGSGGGLSLGQRVKVVVDKVDKLERRIYLSLRVDRKRNLEGCGN